MRHNGNPQAATRNPQPKLHHVAMVVADLDEAVTRYERLGFAGGERFSLPQQAVDVATFRSGEGWIELIQPTDPEGPIARFLAKRGEGMHHVAYAVPDLEAALADCAARGIRLIDAAPRTGAHGWRIAFLHPESCGGVLTELVEAEEVRFTQHPSPA
jgi:methylmalonyl-CoA/ethylmalonyl-CoA epimerase